MARKQKLHHYIYKTTCNITGRYYIGMHSTDNLDDGYLGSGKRLWNSLKKHGRENHSIEILEHYDNRETLKKREAELVREEQLNDPMCMNLAPGGGGFTGDDYTIECASKGSVKGNERLKLLRETDPTWCKNKSENCAKAQKKVYADNKREKKYFFDWNGLQHSEESKQKMRESFKGNGAGETNSQFGTCWITKDGINKKVKKTDIESYIQQGWIRGRNVQFIC